MVKILLLVDLILKHGNWNEFFIQEMILYFII